MTLPDWKSWLSSLKIGRKIGLGYTLALGVAVSGTVVGIGIGHHYQVRAIAEKEYVQNTLALLQRLQSQLLQTQLHQKQLLVLGEDIEAFEHEYEHLLEYKAEMQETWLELSTFVAESSSQGQRLAQPGRVANFLQAYNQVPQQYSQEIERRLTNLEELDFASLREFEQAYVLLAEFIQSDVAHELHAMSDSLVELIDETYQALAIAEVAQQRTSTVAEQLVIASIGLSVAIACLLAIVTSRAIAKPIEELTQTAQRSIDESNFELQAKIYHNDEIGALAHTLNQLIGSVQKLLHQQKMTTEQLEAYSQNLESKVIERTQELNHKNTQLEELLIKLQRTQIQMVQSEKMSALGQMVAGVAHEINNPVNFIYGNLLHIQDYAKDLLEFVQLYQTHYPQPSTEIQTQASQLDIEFIQHDLPKILDSMRLGTERIRQIVLSLRNFSRIDDADFKAVDIHEGIDSTLLILQHRFKERSDRPAIQVIRDYGSLPLVECYSGQLSQAFMNILSNAIDALEDCYQQRNPSPQEESAGQITVQTLVVDEARIQVRIADNGTGMPESVLQRIFDPFFTTKAVGKGTGMGMPITHQIVTEKHGGTLECISRVGEGTEFVMTLPVQQVSPSARSSDVCSTLVA